MDDNFENSDDDGYVDDERSIETMDRKFLRSPRRSKVNECKCRKLAKLTNTHFAIVFIYML